MKNRPLAQRLSLMMALLILAGPTTLAAARPRGNHGRGDHGGPRQAAINGIVASVEASTSSFVLRVEGKKRGRRGSQSLGLTIQTSAKTRFLIGAESAGSFADVSVGARAIVKGTRNADGSVLAQLVVLKVARPPKETSVKGIIDAIDEETASFVLATRARSRDGEPQDVLVQTGNATVFKNEDGSDATFAALAEGDAVEARGALNADGSLQASAIKIHNGDEEPHPVKLIGIVDSVDAETASFSLRPGIGRASGDREGPSFLVHTDGNTAFTKPDGTAGSFADVLVGVKAAVAGARQGEGVLATSVHLAAPEPPREVALRGTVASVDAAAKSFVLNPGNRGDSSREEHPGVLIHTGNATVFQKADGSAGTFADVVAGARVAVKGTATEDRSIHATLVVIAGEEPPREVAVRGTVALVDAASSSFVLKPGDDRKASPEEQPSLTVQTGDGTVFQKSDGSAATFADVVTGARVGVKGTVDQDRVIHAKLVVIGGEEPPHDIWIAGVVTNLDAETHTLILNGPRGENSSRIPSGFTVLTDEDTVFTKGEAAATFAEVGVGNVVKCQGTFNSDRTFHATRVTVFVRGS